MAQKRGRPELPKHKRLTQRVIVRFAPSDMPYLKAKAAEIQKTVAGYLRERGLAS